MKKRQKAARKKRPSRRKTVARAALRSKGTGKKKTAKKSAKKTSAKKKLMAVIPVIPGSCTHTVRLHAGLGVQPDPLPIKGGQGVRWRNLTRKVLKVHFPLVWPFAPPKVTVTLAPGTKSKCFKVRKNLSKGEIKYVVVPAVPFDGPPDSPAVDYQG